MLGPLRRRFRRWRVTIRPLIFIGVIYMPGLDSLSPEADHQIELLAALGLYKVESETIKDSLRKLGSRYQSTKSLPELREELDRKLGDRSLAETVLKLREEETD